MTSSVCALIARRRGGALRTGTQTPRATRNFIMNHRRTLRAPLACVMALCGAAALLSTTALVGCSSQPTGASNSSEGQARVVVAALSQADVSAVTITISGGPSGSGTSTINLVKQADGTWTGMTAPIAVGTGYTFTMSATDSSGTQIYSGTATAVSITLHQTVQVVIGGEQTAPASSTRSRQWFSTRSSFRQSKLPPAT